MKKVLIVDGDSSMLRTSCELVEKMCPGWKPISASSYKDACSQLDKARNNGEPFNLVVTSFRLPDNQDGVLLAKHIETSFPGIACSIFSGGDERDISKRILECGVRTCAVFQRPKSDIRTVLAAHDPMLTPIRVSFAFNEPAASAKPNGPTLH